MHYRFNPTTMSINITITSITCVTSSILKHCPSPLTSRLSHSLQLRSYNNVHHFHHHRHHVYFMQDSFNPITMSITIAISSITCTTAVILNQCPSIPSPSPSPLSHVLEYQSFNSVHHHRHQVYHLHYSFYSITLYITSITIAITSITCITASILKQCQSLPSRSPSRLSHALQLQTYNNVHHHRHHVYRTHYNFNPITRSITIASTSITCIKASIL